MGEERGGSSRSAFGRWAQKAVRTGLISTNIGSYPAACASAARPPTSSPRGGTTNQYRKRFAPNALRSSREGIRVLRVPGSFLKSTTDLSLWKAPGGGRL